VLYAAASGFRGMTKEEATRHEKEIFKADKALEKLYDGETIKRAEAKMREAEKYEC
jgi:hypothetical protein